MKEASETGGMKEASETAVVQCAGKLSQQHICTLTAHLSAKTLASQHTSLPKYLIDSTLPTSTLD